MVWKPAFLIDSLLNLSIIMATHSSTLLPKTTIDTDVSLVTLRQGPILHVSFVIYFIVRTPIDRIDRDALQTVSCMKSRGVVTYSL